MGNLLKIFISPREVFDGMKEDPRMGPPLTTILVIGVICSVLSLVLLGQEAFTEMQADAVEAMNLPAEQVEATRDATASSMGYMVGMIMAPVSMVIGFFIGVLLLATYLLIVAKIAKTEMDWGGWFAFSCWSQMPLVIGYVVGVIVVGATQSMDSQWLSPLTWFGIEGAWAVGISIPAVWSVYIITEGLRSWTGKGMAFSVIVAVIPLAVVILLSQSMQNLMGGLGLG